MALDDLTDVFRALGVGESRMSPEMRDKCPCDAEEFRNAIVVAKSPLHQQTSFQVGLGEIAIDLREARFWTASVLWTSRPVDECKCDFSIATPKPWAEGQSAAIMARCNGSQ
jgi:hypothetical protein